MSKRIAVLVLSLAALALTGSNLSADQITFSIAGTGYPYILAGPDGVTSFDNTGTFEVIAAEASSGASLYQFGVDLFLNNSAATASNPITFTNVTFGPTYQPAPYAFAGNSQDQAYDIPPYFANYGGTTGSAEASNYDESNNGTGTAFASAFALEFVLMQVSYDVPAGTPIGAYALTFNQSGDYVDTVSTANENLVVPQAYDGAIYVVEGPEPSSIILALFGAVGLFMAVRRRR